jgi:L-asparaginase
MSKKTFPIHFIITGGTIDSYDRDIHYPLIPLEKSIIPFYIKSLKLDKKTKFTIACLKDSRDISKTDLKKLLNSIKKSTSKHIIVTCGTFALPDVARFFDLNLKNNKKTIILTGSMIPLYGFPLSDGPFNLGYSVAKVQELPSGVYVCMNGKVFSSNEVLKIVSEGKFDSVFE